MPETAAKEEKAKSADKLLAGVSYSRTFREQWNQNQGTQLLAFACLIFAIGVALLVYRQNKPVPDEIPYEDSMESSGEMQSATRVADSEKNADSVAILVLGASGNGGVLRTAIYDAADGFNDPVNAVLRLTLEIRDSEASSWVPIGELPESFAVAVFHDENENGELDRNRFGIPTERYGFSNNARGLTGPPSYKDAKIDCPKVGQSIKVSIR